MGLLAQGLYGAIGQGADTAAKVMLDDIHAQRDEQLAQANDLRAQNLEKQRQLAHAAENEKQRAFLRDQSDREYNRGPSGMMNAETGVPMTRAEVSQTTPDSYMTPKEYDQRNETERSQAIGEAIKPVLNDFQWDAKNPQQSAADYMQALRSTGQLTESEVMNEANRMLQAKMPKESKLQVATIPVGDGKEQSVIVNLADGTYKPMGKPGPKFAPKENSGLDHFDLLDKKDVVARLRSAQRAYDAAVKAGDTAAVDAAVDSIESLNKDAESAGVRPIRVPKRGRSSESLWASIHGDGRTMPIPERGGGLTSLATAATSKPAAKSNGGYTYVNGKLVPN